MWSYKIFWRELHIMKEKQKPPGKVDGACLPLVLVYHSPLQIATFWEWLTIYFHYGVTDPPTSFTLETIGHALNLGVSTLMT